MYVQPSTSAARRLLTYPPASCLPTSRSLLPACLPVACLPAFEQMYSRVQAQPGARLLTCSPAFVSLTPACLSASHTPETACLPLFCMRSAEYKRSLARSATKALEEGRFTFLVVDANNVLVDDFKDLWSTAQVGDVWEGKGCGGHRWWTWRFLRISAWMILRTSGLDRSGG